MASRCCVVLASTSASATRLGPSVAGYLTTHLEDREEQKGFEDRGFEVDRIDPLLSEQGFLLQLLKKSFVMQRGPTSQLPPPLVRLLQRSAACDAFCLAAPDAEGESPEVLELLLQLGGAEVFGYKPWAICVYSSFSNPRRHLSLRDALTKICAVTVPEAV
eukprot:Skav213213  [mRNA]  locus=scaffold2826:609966:615740:- [translate_table: standard]